MFDAESMTKEDIRRELHRLVESERSRIAAMLNEAANRSKLAPEAQSTEGQAKNEAALRKLAQRQVYADSVFVKFHQFIDEA